MNVVEMVREIWSALSNQVSRGRLIMSAYGPGGQRTVLQGNGLADEVHVGLELLLPYGMSALPVGSTADYLIFQVNATRDHKVAIAVDDPALRIPDLAAGEFGFRNGRGSQVVFRVNKIEVTAPLDDIDVTAALGSINVAASAGNISVTAAQGNVNIVATEGAVSLSGQGGITAAGGAGNFSVNVVGNVSMTATGPIALTAPSGQITANGHVLG